MTLTVGEIRTASKKHKYLCVTTIYKAQYYINSAALFMGANKHAPDMQSTEYVSIRGITLNEYLNNKTPYL